MSSRTPGRHRAPVNPRSTAASFSQLAGAVGGTAGAAAKTGAVLAVSGGLVASLGLQADASPRTPAAVTKAAPAGNVSAAALPAAPVSGTAAAAAVPAALGHGVVAAPTYGAIGFTAKAAPKPKPKPKVKPKPAADDRSDDRTSAAHSERATRSGGDRAQTRRSTRVSRSTERVSRSERRSERRTSRSSVRAGAPGSSSFGASVMRIAARYAGIMYRYGGTTPAGFDCSGYTSYVMRQVGISLPRTSAAQRAAARRVSRSEAVPGDLVFMPGHVGIYAGNGQMWDAPRTGKAISKRKIWSSSATFGRVG